MGMFDSLRDERGDEWQTKAYDCLLDEYHIGDALPHEGLTDYQVEVLGGPDGEPNRDAYATIRRCILSSVGDERDDSLPLVDYYGGPGIGGTP